MTQSKHGFGDGKKTDRQRADLRGKGHQPDYKPGSEEGTRQLGESGLSGDTTSLRGQTTGSQDTPRNDYLGQGRVAETPEEQVHRRGGLD